MTNTGSRPAAQRASEGYGSDEVDVEVKEIHDGSNATSAQLGANLSDLGSILNYINIAQPGVLDNSGQSPQSETNIARNVHLGDRLPVSYQGEIVRLKQVISHPRQPRSCTIRNGLI